MPLAAFPALFRELVAQSLSLARARWRWVLLGTSALLGVLELVGQLYFSQAAPRVQEWVALRPMVEQLAAGGMLIVVSPRWAEPNARLAFGDELMPLRHVARAEDSGFERALEVAILGQSATELRGWQLESELESGRFTLRRWRNPRPEQPLYDFVAHLEPPALSVAIEDSRRGGECAFGPGRVTNGDLFGHPTFPSPRFSCSSNEWELVARTVIEDQNYDPRRCIWAHPPSHGALRLRFEAVPLGTKIRGHAGLPYFFEREKRGVDIELDVRVGAETVGSYRHSDGEGWKEFEFSTQRFAGQTLPVEFRVHAARAAHRNFCFQAETR